MDYRTRLLLSILLASTILLLALVLNRYILLKDILNERVLNRTITLGNVLKEEVQDELAAGDPEKLRETLITTAAQPSVQFVSVVNTEQVVIYSSEKVLENKYNPYDDSPEVGKGELFIRSFPLMVGKESKGDLPAAKSRSPDQKHPGPVPYRLVPKGRHPKSRSVGRKPFSEQTVRSGRISEDCQINERGEKK